MRPYVSLEETLQKLVRDKRIRSMSGIEALPVPELGAYRATMELVHMGSLAEKYPVQYSFAVFGDDMQDACERLGKVLDDWVITQDLNIPLLADMDVWKRDRIGATGGLADKDSEPTDVQR